MRRNTFVFLAFSLVFLAALATAAEFDLAAFVKGAMPVANNVVSALQANDYARAVRDFGPQMRAALTAEKLKATQEAEVKPIIGEIVSYEFRSLTVEGNSVIIIYKLKCTRDEEAVVRVVFDKLDPTFRVTGLWIDSPRLRDAH
jgi:hypothetical protein